MLLSNRPPEHARAHCLRAIAERFAQIISGRYGHADIGRPASGNLVSCVTGHHAFVLKSDWYE